MENGTHVGRLKKSDIYVGFEFTIKDNEVTDLLNEELIEKVSITAISRNENFCRLSNGMILEITCLLNCQVFSNILVLPKRPEVIFKK